MTKLKCSNCGNTEKFIEQYSIRHTAYIDIDSSGKELTDTYDELSDDVSEWTGTFCKVCNEMLAD